MTTNTNNATLVKILSKHISFFILLLSFQASAQISIEYTNEPVAKSTPHEWHQRFVDIWANAETALQEKYGYQYTIFLLQVINSWQHLTFYDKFPDHSFFMEASKITVIDMNQDSIMLSYCKLEPSNIGYYYYRNLRTSHDKFRVLDNAEIPLWITYLEADSFIEKKISPKNLQYYKMVYTSKEKNKTIEANLFSVDITPFKLGCDP